MPDLRLIHHTIDQPERNAFVSREVGVNGLQYKCQ